MKLIVLLTLLFSTNFALSQPVIVGPADTADTTLYKDLSYFATPAKGQINIENLSCTLYSEEDEVRWVHCLVYDTNTQKSMRLNAKNSALLILALDNFYDLQNKSMPKLVVTSRKNTKSLETTSFNSITCTWNTTTESATCDVKVNKDLLELN